MKRKPLGLDSVKPAPASHSSPIEHSIADAIQRAAKPLDRRKERLDPYQQAAGRAEETAKTMMQRAHDRAGNKEMKFPIQPVLKIKKLHKDSILPSKRGEDSGYDLYVSPEFKGWMLSPWHVLTIPTGIACELPIGYALISMERGSTGNIPLAKRAGVTDSGYRGELFVMIQNLRQNSIYIGTETQRAAMLEEMIESMDSFQASTVRSHFNEARFFNTEKAIMQALIIPTMNWDVVEVNELSPSEREDGALGSSNK